MQRFFGIENLKHVTFNSKFQYLYTLKIGITDLIFRVTDTHINNVNDVGNLTREVSDYVMNNYRLELNEEIILIFN